MNKTLSAKLRSAVEKTVNSITLAKVSKHDRKNVREILTGIFTFDERIPRLDVLFLTVKRDEPYVVKVKDWIDSVDVERLYRRFLDPNRRDQIYDTILNIGCTPCEESGDGPIFCFRIAKQNSYEEERLTTVRTTNLTNAVAFTEENEQIFAKVDRKDRASVKAIMRGIMTYETVMPKLDPTIIPDGEHYKLILKGWHTEFDLEQFYFEFLHTRRDRRYETILDACFSCGSAETNDLPTLVMRIAKSEYQDISGKK